MRKLHRVLVTRLLFVAVVVSIAVGVVVVQQERSRVLAVATDRALIRMGTLRALLIDRLDAGHLSDPAEVERLIRIVTYKGFDLHTGHYVLLRALDLDGTEIARAVDPRHEHLEALIEHVAAEPIRPAAESSEPTFTPDRIGENDYLRALVPLKDSAGAVAAYAEGFFATTPAEQAAAFVRLLRALALAAGAVLLTTALLYPILRQLMRRLAQLSITLLDSNLDMLQVVGSAIAKRDSDTDAHNYRVTIYSARIGESLGLDDGLVRSLIKGALLHDVGKIGISDNILLKPGRLDEQEFAVMRQHVKHGLDIVNRSEWLKDAAPIVGGHHEKYDGSGYYGQLRGADIPLQARIFAVADVFDAVTSHRPYHEPLDFDGAMGLLEAGRGKHFDPEILDAFATIARTLFDTYADRDDEELRRDHAAIVERYYRADLTELMG